MPAFPNNPNTRAIGNAIVGFLSALTYADASRVYALAQLESIKDVINLVANGQACVEVYGDTDNSERKTFGGRITDIQHWFILSMCSLDTPESAAQIYDIRDALVQPFQQHAQLNNVVSSVFHSELQNNMRFMRIQRNGQFLRTHLAVLETRSEWLVPTPPGVIS